LIHRLVSSFEVMSQQHEHHGAVTRRGPLQGEHRPVFCNDVMDRAAALHSHGCITETRTTIPDLQQLALSLVVITLTWSRWVLTWSRWVLTWSNVQAAVLAPTAAAAAAAAATAGVHGDGNGNENGTGLVGLMTHVEAVACCLIATYAGQLRRQLQLLRTNPTLSLPFCACWSPLVHYRDHSPES
jgi:hypothetical protein